MTKKFRNKKKFYNNQQNSIFKEGQFFKGILITCPNSKERFAVRDSYRFINEIYEQKFNKNLDEQEEQDIEEHLKNNLEQDDNNQEQVQKNKKNYFAQQIKVKAKGLVFIKLDEKFLPENFLIQNFIDEHIQKVQETQQVISRSIFRILPIEIACQANLQNFKLYMQQLIDKFFDKNCELKKTWCFVYKCRNNSKFQKNQFLDFLRENVPSNFGYYDYKGDFHIVVDITSSFMCLSILPNYNKLNRYSLVQSDQQEKVEKKDEAKIENVKQEELLENNINEEIQLIQYHNYFIFRFFMLNQKIYKKHEIHIKIPFIYLYIFLNKFKMFVESI